VAEGSVGAGTGCTVGNLLGPGQASKSGLGTASIDLGGDVVVGAIVAVKPFGDVVDPCTGQILAGARMPGGDGFVDTLVAMKARADWSWGEGSSTVIGVVATNARLSKEEANKVAQMAHNGLAKTVRPAHTMFDGDTFFALATGQKQSNVNLVGAYAAEVVAEAIIRAVTRANDG